MILYQVSTQEHDFLSDIAIEYVASTGIITHTVTHYYPVSNEDGTFDTTKPKIPQTSTVSFDFGKLSTSNEFSDHSRYLVFADGSYVNLFADTYITKRNVDQHTADLTSTRGRAFDIVIPCVSEPTTYGLVIIATPTQNVSITGDLVLHKVTTSGGLQPQITLEPPTKNGTLLSFPMNVTHPAKVLFTSSLGVVLTPEVVGSGSVLVDVANIPVGTTGTLKAGFKYFTNKKNIAFTV